MDAAEKALAQFTTRMRQLILRLKELKEANKKLTEQVEERDSKIKELEEQVSLLQHDYDNLKLMKMLEVADGDVDSAKKRITKLIRDVNKCITLLSEK